MQCPISSQVYADQEQEARSYPIPMSTYHITSRWLRNRCDGLRIWLGRQWRWWRCLGPELVNGPGHANSVNPCGETCKGLLPRGHDRIDRQCATVVAGATRASAPTRTAAVATIEQAPRTPYLRQRSLYPLSWHMIHNTAHADIFSPPSCHTKRLDKFGSCLTKHAGLLRSSGQTCH